MGIEYLPADNKITVVGYSLGTPCNFTDLWTEDKAGTLELMPATLPALNMTLTTQIKPSDEVALKIDFILASSGAGAGDTIDITGTDKDGNAQTETLTTTADGTFTTTKWFKTITDIDCNGFNSGTLTVRQNQWGVVWKIDSLFTFDAELYWGDGSIATYFLSTREKVVFNEEIRITANADVTLGEWSDSHSGNGCFLKLNKEHASTVWYRVYGTLRIYGTVFDAKMQAGVTPRIYLLSKSGGISDYRETKFNNLRGIRNENTDAYIENVLLRNIPYGFYLAANPVSPWVGSAADEGIKTNLLSGVLSIYDGDMPKYYLYGLTSSLILNTINAKQIAGHHSFQGSDSKLVYQYTFNLKVIDKDGNGIGNATVILKDKDGNTADQKGFSTTTSDADATRGEITEQTVSYGYYNQANGNTLQSYSPHTLTISKTGYQTHTQILTLDEKIDWRIKLIHNPYSNILGLN